MIVAHKNKNGVIQSVFDFQRLEAVGNGSTYRALTGVTVKSAGSGYSLEEFNAGVDIASVSNSLANYEIEITWGVGIVGLVVTGGKYGVKPTVTLKAEGYTQVTAPVFTVSVNGSTKALTLTSTKAGGYTPALTPSPPPNTRQITVVITRAGTDTETEDAEAHGVLGFVPVGARVVAPGGGATSGTGVITLDTPAKKQGDISKAPATFNYTATTQTRASLDIGTSSNISPKMPKADVLEAFVKFSNYSPDDRPFKYLKSYVELKDHF